MCAISGILLADASATVDPARLDAMIESMHHRGPDARGRFVDGPVGLGHNRLSILDLSPAGAQPMHSADGKATIVFNGEVYNFRELRAELEGRGARFRSRSDTEVILEAYRAFGTECLDRIEGMFALAIWDHEARTLLVARDRVGIKPLFYAQTAEGLAFASETKALLPFLRSAEADPVAFSQILLYGYAPSPRALLSGVRKLEPGRAFVVRAGEEPRPSAYWRPRFSPVIVGKVADLREELRQRLAGAVRRQLVSDVPVGAFLSGGLDSSIVVSLMTREFPEAVNTFSVGGAGFEASELPYAKLMSKRLGVRYHPVEVTRDDFLRALPDVAWHNDDPTADPALVPLYLLSKFAKTKVTVALCGEGADELFAGYHYYPSVRQRLARLRRIGAMPAAMRSAVLSMVSLLRGRARAMEFRRLSDEVTADPYAVALRRPPGMEDAVRGLVGDPAASAAKADYRQGIASALPTTADPLEPSLRVDMRYNLADFLLTRADNMAMAAGLEGRVPFLDEQVVEFATRLHGDAKLDGQRGKAILRDAFADLLPPEILKRPKAPFPVPLSHWVLSDKRFLRDTLAGGELVARGYLHSLSIERFLCGANLAHPNADVWDCTVAWRLLYLEVWARRVLGNSQVVLAA